MDTPVPHPLVYAVIEIRVPFAPRLSKGETAELLQEALAELPVLRAEKRQRLVPKDGNIQVEIEDGWRFLDLANSRSLVVTNTSIVYETTRYPGFETFLGEFIACLHLISEHARPAGYERLGLRYINEVWPTRPVQSFDDWKQWIAPELVTTLVRSEGEVHRNVDGDRPQLRDLEVHLQFSLADNCALTTRVATQTGLGVVGNDPLKRWVTPAAAGNFCVIDFDGFWPRIPDSIQPFDIEKISRQLKAVHNPVKGGFGWATTHEFRQSAKLKDNYV
ncbi:TIGR04255 family protein [Microlunatus phosphovorus]|nr:TIGR04255 family protein [Microlunatus phosphovorus]